MTAQVDENTVDKVIPRNPVLGIDPGKTSGWFFWDGVFNEHCHLQADELYRALRLQLHREPNTLLAVEKFVITPQTARNSQQTEAIKVIGAIEEIVLNLNASTPLYHTSSEAKLAASDRLLKPLGWHKRGKKHANDAARHALVALSKRDYPTYLHLLDNIL